ncbi:MAG: fused MFS/spermidine synthase [Elusimicrobia bacterium]|nr:fused MFS/spermidine synthase [Elusimicrobiota bacterium]
MTAIPINLNRGKLVLFSFTLFLSAALMFALQPMLGKMLLPLVGGASSGWIVALAFFQVTLLAGYFLAHLLSGFEPRTQGLLYLLCLGAGCFFLPVVLSGHTGAAGSTPAAFDVFLLLAAGTAAPFIALSATTATLQRLFTTTGHALSRDPYFLYGASNLGSFTGLLLYPFFIEPRSTLTTQSHGWLGGYLLLIGSAALCLLMSGKKAPQKAVTGPPAPIGPGKRLEWLCLALLPSGLLLGVTAYITTDILSAPLLWMLPLGIYLLTFVIAFGKRPLVRYDLLLKTQPVAVAVILVLTLLMKSSVAGSWYALGAHLAAFGIVALMCHMRLARARPLPEPRQLTAFYLMIALGGALGGILNAFIAPLLFNSMAEYPLMMLASNLLNDDLKSKLSRRYMPALITAYALLAAHAVLRGREMSTGLIQSALVIIIFILSTLHSKMSLTIGAAILLAVFFNGRLRPAVVTARNFYGVIKVFDKPEPLNPEIKITVRYMQHGTTLHGSQILDKEYETTPTAYYTREGPLNDVIALIKPKTIAAVGLGPGTINCFAAPGREVVFFELDPAVVKIAKEQFTYLSKCGPGTPRIVVGDARLELQRETEKFDLIILDAFSSDTVPTHLLTREAVELYLRRLAPGGVILFHVSNRHFRLEGPIAATGETLGLKNAAVARRNLPQPYAKQSRWLALTRQSVDLRPLAGAGWTRVTLLKKTRPWTDDYIDLLSALKF